jgi:zinc protease
MSSPSRKIFPYKYSSDDFPNGLRLITVPTDFPNLVSIHIVVATGSRNEIEEGKSGFAHLFEHLMFRGTDSFPTQKYEQMMKQAGAHYNAYTTDDRTVYHATFSKEDLEQTLMIEADRFQHLRVPMELFKTETRAVLGEYNKNASNPLVKVYETLRDTAFTTHTYKHTTMGFLRDIERMPDMYDYSLEFFDRYYRPEYTTIVVVGDVDGDRVRSIVDRHWSGWRRGSYAVDVPAEPAQAGERAAHVEWATTTLPWVTVAYKAPGFSEDTRDKAALDLIASLAFSENSELYQKLIIKEQKADVLFADADNHRDPYLVVAGARVRDAADVEYVRREIVSAFEAFSGDSIDEKRLDAVKSNQRYSFALSLDNSESIAACLAPYIALRRSPEALNRLFDVYSSVVPADLQTASRRYLTEENRTVVTLSHTQG